MNKKVFTIVIIILLIVLWAQLYYYAHSSDAEKTSIPNSYDFTNDGSQIENELASASTQLQTMNDNYSLVFGQYNGPVTQNEFSVYVDSLINYKMKDLYTKLERKSTNDIKLYYDRHTNEIADYNIYSGEELVNVYNELCQVNWNRKHICISKNINMDTVNYNDNGYTTFTINFNYSNGYSIDLKFSIANSSESERRIILSTNN